MRNVWIPKIRSTTDHLATLENEILDSFAQSEDLVAIFFYIKSA